MVKEPLHLELWDLWFPTRASAERHAPMNIEGNLNMRPITEEGPSIAEVAWTTGNIDRAMALLPDILPAQMRRIARRLLQPWPDGRYTEAYRRTGGILNMFTPPWGEKEDEVWAGMVSRWKATSFADKEERRAAFQALEQEWNTTPHPFFAGLTPAQVMIGGGREEGELAHEFLLHLATVCEDWELESEGDALVKTLMLLRGWEAQQRQDGRTPREIIVTERNRLLERRTQALQSSGGIGG